MSGNLKVSMEPSEMKIFEDRPICKLIKTTSRISASGRDTKRFFFPWEELYQFWISKPRRFCPQSSSWKHPCSVQTPKASSSSNITRDFLSLDHILVGNCRTSELKLFDLRVPTQFIHVSGINNTRTLPKHIYYFKI